MNDQPQRASAYRLQSLVARGGMGEVWRATLQGAAGFEKPVAVKRILAHLEEDPEFLARFFDEARIAAALTHGNIVSVFDLGVDEGGTYFLAMEWVDGWDLRKIIRSLAATDNAIPPDIAARIAADVCAALAYAHQFKGPDDKPLQLVHRDVSPSNVILSRAGEVRLTDFGIASARERLGRTATGQLRGKFSYMSPEQAAGQPADARSDIFAVGALLFEMLCGRKAFDGMADLEVLDKVRSGARDAVAEACQGRDVPEAIQALCERALQVSPDERFQSAEDMERALRDAIVNAWGTVPTARLRDWANDRLDPDPLLKAQSKPGGANLDDLLAAQLDALPPTTPSASQTDSRAIAARAAVAAHRSGTAPRHAQTVTHGPLTPSPKPRRSGLLAFVALSSLAIVALFLLTRTTHPTLIIESEPPGAQVYIDGTPRGVTALTTQVALGEREVRVQLPGYAPETLTVDVQAETTEPLLFALRAADRAIVFHSFPTGALVTVNDTQVPAGNTVNVPVGVPVRVRMEREGFVSIDESVTFSAHDSVFTRRMSPIAPEPAAGGDVVAINDPPTTPPDSAPTRRDRDASDAPTRDTAPTREETPRSATPPTAENPGLPGHLTLRFVTAPMVGRIVIDGEDRGTNQDLRAMFELPPGTHTIEVVNDTADVRFARTIEVQSGDAQTHTVEWQ